MECETIIMDFITCLPKTRRKNDFIMVVIDKPTKSTYFIHVKSTHKEINIDEMFMKDIFMLHGIPKTMITYRDVKFTSKFWKGIFALMDTKLDFSTTYNSQTDGQTEQVNQVLEDTLHMYVMKHQGKWEDLLHLVEFAYNNGYEDSL